MQGPAHHVLQGTALYEPVPQTQFVAAYLHRDGSLVRTGGRTTQRCLAYAGTLHLDVCKEARKYRCSSAGWSSTNRSVEAGISICDSNACQCQMERGLRLERTHENSGLFLWSSALAFAELFCDCFLFLCVAVGFPYGVLLFPYNVLRSQWKGFGGSVEFLNALLPPVTDAFHPQAKAATCTSLAIFICIGYS